MPDVWKMGKKYLLLYDMKTLYNIAMGCYRLGVALVAPWNRKAKLWIDGRKNLLERVRASVDVSSPIIWVHVASLGEFEQGRPIIEKIKAERPEYKILLTFFSPSGYEIRKNYQGADYIFYLPLDTPSNAREFLDIVKPQNLLDFHLIHHHYCSFQLILGYSSLVFLLL